MRAYHSCYAHHTAFAPCSCTCMMSLNVSVSAHNISLLLGLTWLRIMYTALVRWSLATTLTLTLSSPGMAVHACVLMGKMIWNCCAMHSAHNELLDLLPTRLCIGTYEPVGKDIQNTDVPKRSETSNSFKFIRWSHPTTCTWNFD